MNILPFVLGFLLLLSILSSSFFTQTLSTLWEEKALKGYFHAKQLVHNKLERRSYEQSKTPKASSSSAPRKTSIYTSRREMRAYNDLSKLNLAPLLFAANNPPPPFLYETAAKLLHLLYQDSTLSKSGLPNGFEYLLLDEWIEMGRSKKKIDSLAALYPQDPKLSSLFYKMLKGTKRYNLTSRSGYPPLEEFFCIDKEAKEPIYFHFASKPLLNALFGINVAEAILELEKKRWEEDGKHHTLTKEELSSQLLQKQGGGFPVAIVLEHLNFTKKRSSLEMLVGVDAGSGIDVKKKLSSRPLQGKSDSKAGALPQN